MSTSPPITTFTMEGQDVPLFSSTRDYSLEEITLFNVGSFGKFFKKDQEKKRGNF